MKKAIAVFTLGLSLMSSAAIAAERTTDAAIGAVSGAVVFGPIGAVAGALVGYSAGPSISHSWSSRRSRTAHQRTRARETPASMSANPTAGDQMSASSAAAASPPPAQGTAVSKSTASTNTPSAPPVQALE
jgi:hypothetical protein